MVSLNKIKKKTTVLHTNVLYCENTRRSNSMVRKFYVYKRTRSIQQVSRRISHDHEKYQIKGFFSPFLTQAVLPLGLIYTP
jgi:16S rRNA C1402 (ribose-2'-O) methylase RsmI